jgi:hypothetical protein
MHGVQEVFPAKINKDEGPLVCKKLKRETINWCSGKICLVLILMATNTPPWWLVRSVPCGWLPSMGRCVHPMIHITTSCLRMCGTLSRHESIPIFQTSAVSLPFIKNIVLKR